MLFLMIQYIILDNIMDNVYYKKYLKYKTKYLNLCSQKAGGCHDYYCFICGGPTYSTEVIEDITLFKKYLKKADYDLDFDY